MPNGRLQNSEIMKSLKKILLIGLFIVTGNLSFAQDKAPNYKEVVTQNLNAEADIKVVSDYTNALVNNKMEEAAKHLSEKYMGYGPAENDSINKKDTIEDWKKSHLVRSNQKVSFLSESFTVLQGDLEGNWVSQWGTYVFTQNGKEITLPFQSTSQVSNGKIDTNRIYFDNLAVVMALGYTLTPPEEK